MADVTVVEDRSTVVAMAGVAMSSEVIQQNWTWYAHLI